MPKRVRPYGSAVDAESAALARNRSGAGAELVSDVASTITARDVASQAAEAVRALNDLTSDGAGYASLDQVRAVIASLQRMSLDLPRLCEQLARMLVVQHEDGQITPGPGQDLDFWVTEAVEALAAAGQAADMLAAALSQAGKTSGELRSASAGQLCRADLDRDRPAQRVPDRRGGGHLPVQFGHCGLVGVGVEVDGHPDGGVRGLPGHHRLMVSRETPAVAMTSNRDLAVAQPGVASTVPPATPVRLWPSTLRKAAPPSTLT